MSETRTVYKMFEGRKGIFFNDIVKTKSFIQSGCSYKWYCENVRITDEDITIGTYTGKMRKCYVVINGYNNFEINNID